MLINVLPSRSFSPHDSSCVVTDEGINVNINMTKRFKLVVNSLRKFGSKGVPSAEFLATHLNHTLRCDVYNKNHIRHVLVQLSKHNIIEFDNDCWRLTISGFNTFNRTKFIALNKAR